jgi:hypothetical protein
MIFVYISELAATCVPYNITDYLLTYLLGTALVVWLLAPEFVGSNPAEVVAFFRYMKKSSACLPSEGK